MEENANEALAVQNEIKATIAELEEEAKKVADDYEKYNRIMGNIVALLEG
jgi:ABC-type transporter lipoprotein component MlaA